MSNADSTPVIVEQPQAQPEEMESPTEDTFEKLETQKPAAAVTAAQIRRIHTIKTTLGIEDEKYRDRLQKLYSVASSKDLTKQQAADLIKRMEAAGPA
jgi:hypothetical protein